MVNLYYNCIYKMVTVIILQSVPESRCLFLQEGSRAHSKNTRVSRDPEKGPLGPNSIPGQRWPGNQSNWPIIGSDWPRSGSYFASSWLISGSTMTRNGVWPQWTLFRVTLTRVFLECMQAHFVFWHFQHLCHCRCKILALFSCRHILINMHGSKTIGKRVLYFLNVITIYFQSTFCIFLCTKMFVIDIFGCILFSIYFSHMFSILHLTCIIFVFFKKKKKMYFMYIYGSETKQQK